MLRTRRLAPIAAMLAIAASSSAFANNSMPSRTPVSYTSKPTTMASSNVKHEDPKATVAKHDDPKPTVAKHEDARNQSLRRDDKRDDKRDDSRDRNSRGRDDDRRGADSRWNNDSMRQADFRYGSSGGRSGRDNDLDLNKIRRNDPEATFWKDLGQDPWSPGKATWKQGAPIDGHSVWTITGGERGVTYYKVYDNNADRAFWSSQAGNKGDQTLWRLSDGGRGVTVLRDNERGITLYKIYDDSNRRNPVIGRDGFRPVDWSKVDDDDRKGDHKHRDRDHDRDHRHHHGDNHHHPRPPVSGT